MADSEILLLLHGGDPRLGVVAHRLRRLGYRAVSAKGPAQALELAAESRLRASAILVGPGVMVADVSGALDALRTRCADGRLGILAVGPRPDPATRQRLRVAGVELAAFEPCEDSTLRFQLNRAMSYPDEHPDRRETRVPADLPAQVHASGRSKSAMVRALSASGAFLETRRPSLPGVPVELELSLPPETVQVVGRVVYTNVPGNLQRANLPTGMAVSFTELPPGAERAIRHCVAERALTLVV
jgi:hypothetical protein